jgi:hypothetical protein
MPLRDCKDPSSAQATATHQLQLFNLPSHGGIFGYYDKSKVKIIARRGALDRYVWGDKCLALCRCATCGCVTHWQPIGRASNRMGVNFRNFDASVIGSTRVRRFDGANTWKFLD